MGVRQLRWQHPVPAHPHRTERVIGCKGREAANGVGVGIGVGTGNEDGNGVVRGNGEDVNGDEAGNGAGTRAGAEDEMGVQPNNTNEIR